MKVLLVSVGLLFFCKRIKGRNGKKEERQKGKAYQIYEITTVEEI
jgi:hypothetical protein